MVASSRMFPRVILERIKLRLERDRDPFDDFAESLSSDSIEDGSRGSSIYGQPGLLTMCLIEMLIKTREITNRLRIID